MRIYMKDFALLNSGKCRFTRRLSSGQIVMNGQLHSVANQVVLQAGQCLPVSKNRFLPVLYEDKNGFIVDIVGDAKVLGYANAKKYVKAINAKQVRLQILQVEFVQDVRQMSKEFLQDERLTHGEFLARWLQSYSKKAYEQIAQICQYNGLDLLQSVASAIDTDEQVQSLLGNMDANLFIGYTVKFKKGSCEK